MLTFNTQLSVTMNRAPWTPAANLSTLRNSVLRLLATEPQLTCGGLAWICRVWLIGWFCQLPLDQYMTIVQQAMWTETATRRNTFQPSLTCSQQNRQNKVEVSTNWTSILVVTQCALKTVKSSVKKEGAHLMDILHAFFGRSNTHTQVVTYNRSVVNTELPNNRKM